uniref:Threonylcarbamoyl-AMP synthase n=1 Tax=Glycine max TaxID=3847 RepID=A0A0R0HBS4_SOYBN
MSCSVSVDNSDMVHPATDAYAGEAVEALKAGSLEAVNRIYEIKGRRHTSPLAICVGDVSDIARFAVTDHLPHGLLDCLLPGPVIVESSILERSLNPGFDSIGVRVPDCNFIRIIACGSGTALALTSANLSGQSSTLSIKDFENLWEHCFLQRKRQLPSWRSILWLRQRPLKQVVIHLQCHILARPNVSLAKEQFFRLDM